MEKITFRGKVLYNGNHYFSGDWVKGFYFENRKEESFIIDTEPDEFGNVSFEKVQVSPDTVSEYIGRKSISDKKVYSGDKVNIIDRDGKKYNDLTVVWDDDFCGFKAENEDWKLFFFRIEYIEIIGNIHD